MPTPERQNNAAKTKASTPGAKAPAVAAPAQTPGVTAPELGGALGAPRSARPAAILHLQRVAGNRAVQRVVQRADANEIQREPEIGLEGGEVGGDLQDKIHAARGGGQPLDRNVGAQIGSALGADFSGVRVHTDAQSESLNRSLSARAFTLGSDVFFSKGAYNPATQGGKQLLAHELTHVVQQGSAGARGQRTANKIQTKLTVGAADDLYEQEADRVAKSVVHLSSGSPPRAHRFIQRHPNHRDEEVRRSPLSLRGAGRSNHIQRAPLESYGGTFTDVRYEGVKGKGQVGAIIDLAFTPNEMIKSPKIGLTQTVKAMKDGRVHAAPGRKDLEQRMMGPKDMDPGRFLDRGAPKDLRNDKHYYQENPIFGMENQPTAPGRSLGAATSRTIKANRLAGEDVAHPDVLAGQFGSRDDLGNVVPATLHDEPGRDVGGDLDMRFETAAVVVEGPQSGTYLGSIEWGFTASGTSAPVLYPFKLLSMGTPTKAFMKSVQLWNKQTDLEMLTQETKVVGKPSLMQGESRSFLKLADPAHRSAVLDFTGKTPSQQVEILSKRIDTLRKELASTKRMSDEDKNNKTLELNALERQRTKLRNETRLMTPAMLTAMAGGKSRKIGSSSYDKVLNALGSSALGSDTPDTKRQALKDAQTATRGWQALNATRTKKGDEEKRAQLEFLDRQLSIELHVLDHGDMDPALRSAFLSEEGTLQFIIQNGRMIEAVCKTYFETFGADALTRLLVALAERDPDEFAMDADLVAAGLLPPDAFGDAMSARFIQLFKQNNDSDAYFQQLARAFPSLTSRLHMAYRQAFGKQKASAAVTEKFNRPAAPILDPVAALAKSTFLAHGPFAKLNHNTSIGTGRFDANFDPVAKELKITMKLFYDFADNDSVTQQELVRNGQSPESARLFGGKQWTPALRNEYMDQFEGTAQHAWAGKYIFTVDKPGWEDVVAVPRFEFIRVPTQPAAHFTIAAKKSTLGDVTGKRQLKGQGTSGLGGTTLTIQQSDVKDKLRDPLVHAYLHAAEEGHVNNAYENDRQRLEAALASVPTIQFNANSSSVAAASTADLLTLAQNLKKQMPVSTLAHLHAIVIAGSIAPAESPTLALLRAQMLQYNLKQEGVQQVIKAEAGAAGTATATVAIGQVDPAIRAKFIDNWTRVSAAHEFGHMLGLTDEYNTVAADELRDQMIDEGLLPAATPRTHLANHALYTPRHRDYARLIHSAGVETPAFNSATAVKEKGDQAHTTGVMTGGFEVMKANYVTLWEVLGQMTNGVGGLTATDWKIE